MNATASDRRQRKSHAEARSELEYFNVSKPGNESNAQHLAGFSAVLPGNELLKKQAVLLDSIVCDDLSFHFVKERESPSAREFRAHIDAVYKARVAELRWLRDAGVLLSLERFAQQTGITKDELDRMRKISQEATVQGLRGDGPHVARIFVAAYGRSMAGHLRSRDNEVVSISVLNGPTEVEHQDATVNKLTEVVEVLLEKMPQVDNGANWDAILEIRRDPRFMNVRADLRHFLRRLARQEFAHAQVRDELSALYQRYEELMTLYNVTISYGPVQVVLTASGSPSWADHLPPDLGFSLRRRTIRTIEANAGPGSEISYAFPGVHSPEVSEEPGPSVYAPSAMISLPDLGHGKPSLEQLVEIAKQFNAGAGTISANCT
jgi:hypothetical protein